jgi:hypothetical protein
MQFACSRLGRTVTIRKIVDNKLDNYGRDEYLIIDGSPGRVRRAYSASFRSFSEQPLHPSSTR